MKKSAGTPSREVQQLFLQEELSGDRLVNSIRFGLLFVLLFLALLKEGLFTGLRSSPSLTFTLFLIGFGYLYTIGLFLLYRKDIYHPALKYVSVTFDIALVVLSVYAYKLDPYPEYGTIFFLARTSLIFWFILWSLLRYNTWLSLYSGVVAAVLYLFLIAFDNVMAGTLFTFTGPDGVLYTSEFAYREIYLKVAYFALGGVVAAFVAQRLRSLVIRSISHEQERNRLATQNTIVETVNAENRKYLDAITEGLLLVDSSYRIGDQYSRFMNTLFRREDIAGKNLVDFLFPDLLTQATERKELEKFLHILFTNANADEETLRDINPVAETVISIPAESGEPRDLTLNVMFHRIIKDGNVENVMAIFEDRTDILAAQKSLERAQSHHDSEIEMISVILRTGPWTLQNFIEESRAVLLQTTRSLPTLADKDVINRCFRGLHGLKGSSSSLGFSRIAEQAHALEDVLAGIRDQGKPVTRNTTMEMEAGIQDIFSNFDIIQKLTKGFLEFSQMEQPADTENTMARLEEFLESLRTMVADLGRQLEKKVVLRVSNALREMPFLPKMKNALIHLIRNSVDHGIEDMYERMAAGKQEEGLITLRLFLQDGYYVLELSDDGGGLNMARIKEKAIERKLLDPGTEDVSPSKLLNILFSPGFSTLDTADSVSGRGVGMDIVRDAVNGLKGSISVSTKKGNGTKVTLRIPIAYASRPLE